MITVSAWLKSHNLNQRVGQVHIKIWPLSYIKSTIFLVNFQMPIQSQNGTGVISRNQASPLFWTPKFQGCSGTPSTPAIYGAAPKQIIICTKKTYIDIGNGQKFELFCYQSILLQASLGLYCGSVFSDSLGLICKFEFFMNWSLFQRSFLCDCTFSSNRSLELSTKNCLSHQNQELPKV